MKEHEYLEDIKTIRQVMERNTKFMSLNGLSGVLAGIYALAGAAYAHSILSPTSYDRIRPRLQADEVWMLLLDAIIVLALSISTGFFLSYSKAKRNNLKLWDNTVKQMITHSLLPLVSGGILVLTLVFRYQMVGVAAPLTLIFYGLALISASKFTYGEIRSLGIAETLLGLISMWFIGYGLFFWAVGFGILHIVYGTYMYWKYK
ncbi:hypothetical protein FUAX_10710 [Fulvitalea axinellae]|uniref:Yip1 domain-containing protein n=1 Tax=Fulvitalea axinellae TaxID=1182444 RepID=A0AAU9C9D6_9BACT|nr:hypothetical protein FUAX_10710 [Fulvitalea axinellae]